MKCCPTCLRPLPPANIQVRGAKPQALLDYVLAHPDGVRTRQIFDIIYAADPNGGPLSLNIVAVMVNKLNRHFEKQDVKLRIRGTGGPGSVYRAVYL